MTTQSSRLLAIDGGTPVRAAMLPYGRQWVDESDVAAVVEALRSDWLTTGPRVSAFEQAFAAATGAREAVAVSNGTAALHAAAAAMRIGPGDEVIVPALTFAASASCVMFQGARPVFADVEPETLLVDPADVARRLTPHTRAIVAVDYAGQPCDYDALQTIATGHRLHIVADAAHSLGAMYRDRPVGTLADVTAFSLHPVKHITTGEGGMVTTDNSELAAAMRRFRNHGMSEDHRERQLRGSWLYEIAELGYNYRLTDLQCALGHSQLLKLPAWVERRRAIARFYNDSFRSTPGLRPLASHDDRSNAYHLYIVRFDSDRMGATRDQIIEALRSEGIGANVHYLPVHLHRLYRERCGTAPGDCPVAEQAFQEIVTLPLFPQMTDSDAGDVVQAVHKIVQHFSG